MEHCPSRVQLSPIDLPAAYFIAKRDPEKTTVVALPTEGQGYQGTCGLLLKHLYGSQAAADGRQQEYSSTMVSLGFR